MYAEAMKKRKRTLVVEERCDETGGTDRVLFIFHWKCVLTLLSSCVVVYWYSLKLWMVIMMLLSKIQRTVSIESDLT